MKIKAIKLRDLRNDGHFQFFQFLIALIQGIGAALLKVEKQFAALVALHAQEDEAFRKITKSAHTAYIDYGDQQRDDVFRSMANTIRAGLTHFNATVRDAAARIQIVMNTYGNVAQKSTVDETSAIYNLTQELSASKHAADVDALGLGQWITELNRRNANVQRLLEERADEGAARTSLVLKDVRAQVDAAYHALAELIDAHATIALATDDAEATALYGDFIGRLNQRIDLLNKSLVRHHAQTENPDDATPETTGK